MNKIPEHIAIIMDGNGRWAKALGKIRTQGHYQGVKNVRNIAIYAGRHSRSSSLRISFV